MDINLPIPTAAANTAIEMRDDDEQFPAYPWQAVRMIVACELPRFAEAAESARLRPPEEASPGYDRGLADGVTAPLELIRGRAAVLDDDGGEPNDVAG